MPDKFSSETRSHIMSSIRSKNTKPEMMVRSALWKLGLRYRIHFKLPGKPDIVFNKQKIVIFIDGCFWHKCPECFKPPKSNTKYWKPKLQRNVERDRINTKKLKNMDWIVLRFWEHEVKNDLERVINSIVKLHNNNSCKNYSPE
ncbi:MAG: very short patch repair endonuclease [Candidatus Delongbacteria bacterium]|nr:very short patch repair endonuclease [Candidatus Delongbacteria bacterium]